MMVAKTLVSLIYTIVIFGIGVFVWDILTELYKNFGTIGILSAIAFIGLWAVCYVIIDD